MTTWSRRLMRWDPFAEFGELRSRFDRMFDELAGGCERTWTPTIDVVREDGKLVMRADISGIKPEEVKIEVEDDILTVSGEHEERKEEKDTHYLRRERRYGSFSRSLVLPAGVDASKIEAKTRDGIVGGDDPASRGSEEEEHHDYPDCRLRTRALGAGANRLRHPPAGRSNAAHGT